MDDMSLVYNINLCRICQIPEHLDLVQTDITSGNGDTYLGLLKYIFEDIFWIEDELISLACKTCLEKVTDIAEFKRLCLETNGRRGALTFETVKVEHVAIKLEEDQAFAELADVPEAEAAPQHRAKRKLSVCQDDQSVHDLKCRNVKWKTKRKQNENVSDLDDLLIECSKGRRKARVRITKKVSTSEKAKEKCNTKKNINTSENLEKSDRESEDNAGLDDVYENSENGDVENENKIAKSEIAERKIIDIPLKPIQITKQKSKVKSNTIEVPNKVGNLEKSDSGAEDNVGLEIKNLEETKSINSDLIPEYTPRNKDRTCRVCKVKFDSSSELKEHISANHLKCRNPPKYNCDICPESFSELNYLERHIFRHNGTRNHICTICGQKYITVGDLWRHRMRHEDAKFVCDICPNSNKTYKTKSDLRTHKIIVHAAPEDYKYLCTECGAKFIVPGALKVHMVIHTNIKNFSCHLCDKSFGRKNVLQAHLTSHSNVRQFKCDLCPSEYKRKYMLSRHKTKTHGIGNYKYKFHEKADCKVCGKNIASKDNMQRHMRTHTGVRPYKCRLCNQKFICASYIKGHIRTKHDIIVDDPDFKTSLYYEVESKGSDTDADAEPTDGANKQNQ